MSWLWQVSVSTSPESEEAVVESFQEVFGVAPSVFLDASTGEATISTYVNEPRGRVRRCETKLDKNLRGALGIDKGPKQRAVRVRRIRRRDWAESWKRHFHPIEIGGSLLIRPSWSRKRPKRGQSVIVLDPGLSFGTGQHPTTLYCLEQVVRYHQPGRTQAFLDIGTGSGILAIAAARLGYGPVLALDSDPDAARIGARNARQNGLRSQIQIVCEDLRELASRKRGEFALVCANLTTELLVKERARILNCIAPDGILVLAGILESEFAELRRCYSMEGLKPISSRAGREWRSGVFRRRR